MSESMNFSKVEQEMFLDAMKSRMEIILAAARHKSEYNRERYNALKKEGFTDDQALHIVTNEKTPFDGVEM